MLDKFRFFWLLLTGYELILFFKKIKYLKDLIWVNVCAKSAMAMAFKVIDIVSLIVACPFFRVWKNPVGFANFFKFLFVFLLLFLRGSSMAICKNKTVQFLIRKLRSEFKIPAKIDSTFFLQILVIRWWFNQLITSIVAWSKPERYKLQKNRTPFRFGTKNFSN